MLACKIVIVDEDHHCLASLLQKILVRIESLTVSANMQALHNYILFNVWKTKGIKTNPFGAYIPGKSYTTGVHCTKTVTDPFQAQSIIKFKTIQQDSQNGNKKDETQTKLYLLFLGGPVLNPLLQGLPHGVREDLPWLPLLLLLPSPPPWGWSTGFMATPRTTGLRPNHLLCPAFLSFFALCSGFDTVPIVALHRESISFSFPEGSLIKQCLDAFGSLRIFAEVPAALTNLPPWPGFISMLWISVPIRIIEIGMQLPIWELRSAVNIWFIIMAVLRDGVVWVSESYALVDVLKERVVGWRTLARRVDEAVRTLERAIWLLSLDARDLFW